jgi:hypothetical protein
VDPVVRCIIASPHVNLRNGHHLVYGLRLWATSERPKLRFLRHSSFQSHPRIDAIGFGISKRSMFSGLPEDGTGSREESPPLQQSEASLLIQSEAEMLQVFSPGMPWLRGEL